MKLGTGKVPFEIEFDNGEKGTIWFAPTDRGFQSRINEFEKNARKNAEKINLEKYRSAFEREMPEVDIENIDAILSLSEDDLAVLQGRINAAIAIEQEYNDVIKKELNNVFQSDISSVVFRFCEPYDIITYVDDSGKERSEMFVFQFLRGLAAELKKYGVHMSEAASKHISKYRK